MVVDGDGLGYTDVTILCSDRCQQLLDNQSQPIRAVLNSSTRTRRLISSLSVRYQWGLPRVPCTFVRVLEPI
jgi:hypothetical protein